MQIYAERFQSLLGTREREREGGKEFIVLVFLRYPVSFVEWLLAE